MAAKLKTSTRKKKSAVEKPTLDVRMTAIIKAEAQITSNALEVEDTFQSNYDDGVIVPEINPEKYYSLVEQNNALNQCISAMEVNIDGTGSEILRADGEDMTDEDRAETKNVSEVLTEVFPGMSYTTLRREHRRQLEISGYGVIEVIRNPAGGIVFLRPLESKSIRLMKLGLPITATRTLLRGGVEVKTTLQVRERRFVQLNANRKVYFKEFGSNRDLHKNTGVWSKKGETLPSGDRATEIIYQVIHRSAASPYGVPRWLNQLPSVVGSRSAEELNLEYFESGGIPPMMIFISGGAMAEVARKQLEALLSGRAKDKLKGIVADIQSTSGTIEKGGGVKVDVESFGSEKQNDSMFEHYDERCEQRIRASFRLPPLFIGKADDYSYASVFASYTLAEAQVFAPERMEFDEIMNNSIMKDLTGGKYILKSNPLTVADANTNIQSLILAMNGQAITKKTLIDELNMIGTVNLKPLLADEDDIAERNIGMASSEGEDSSNGQNKPPAQSPISTTIAKSAEVLKFDLSYLGDLAKRQADSLTTGLSKEDNAELVELMKQLNSTELGMVQMLVANRIYASVDNDSEGMTELCGCVVDHTKSEDLQANA